MVGRATRPGVRRALHAGFTYLIVLFAVALLGTGLAVIGQVWHTASLHEKEAELLFAGGAIRKAIASYYQRTPGAAKAYPPSIEHLLKDPRFPDTVRHLRVLYRDPITGTQDWGLLIGPGGGIMGVYSKSEARPLKQANFAIADRVFEERTLQLQEKITYQDWQFAFPTGAVLDLRTPQSGSSRGN